MEKKALACDHSSSASILSLDTAQLLCWMVHECQSVFMSVEFYLL